MSNIPKNLKYTKSHEWIRVEDDIATVGITEHAQELLGELVYVEVPEISTDVEAGEEVAVVESVKAAADVYAPISGEIIEVNIELANSPELVNNDPYNEGWLFQIKIANSDELNELLDSDAYSELLASEGH